MRKDKPTPAERPKGPVGFLVENCIGTIIEDSHAEGFDYGFVDLNSSGTQLRRNTTTPPKREPKKK